MSESPFQSPSLEPSLLEGETLTKVVLVAKYQRWINWAVLGYLAFYLAQITILAPVFQVMASQVQQGQGNPQLLLVSSLATFALSLTLLIFCMVSVFLLVRQFDGVVTAIVMAVLQLVPCVSLLILLVASRKATKFLKQHHVKVGFMGASEEMVRQQMRAAEEAEQAGP